MCVYVPNINGECIDTFKAYINIFKFIKHFLKRIMYLVLVNIASASYNHLIRRKGLLWFTILEVSVHDWVEELLFWPGEGERIGHDKLSTSWSGPERKMMAEFHYYIQCYIPNDKKFKVFHLPSIPR